jgi:hypothetical protein
MCVTESHELLCGRNKRPQPELIEQLAASVVFSGTIWPTAPRKLLLTVDELDDFTWLYRGVPAKSYDDADFEGAYD